MSFKPICTPSKSNSFVISTLSFKINLQFLSLHINDFSFVFAVLTEVIVGGTSIMGGKGAIWRTVAAAFFLAFMNNGFNLLQVDPLWQRIILGLVIVIAVALDSWSQRKNV